jgi:hypothetical protein
MASADRRVQATDWWAIQFNAHEVPTTDPLVDCKDTFCGWEEDLKSYCEPSGDAATDRMRIAVVGLYAPQNVESAVMLATMSCADDFKRF